MELEFFPIYKENQPGIGIPPAYLKTGEQTNAFFEDVNKTFASSKFVERMYKESDGKWEIVIGGIKKGVIPPDTRLLPSTITNANEGVRRTIERKSRESRYGIDGIMYDASAYGRKVAGQHCTISLWTKDGHPLFKNLSDDKKVRPLKTTPLTMHCSKNLLEAQYNLIAMMTPSDSSIQRFGSGYTLPSEIRLGATKHDYGCSAAMRLATNNKNECEDSLYLENRLAGADVMPALAMLMTLGGIERGVEELKRISGGNFNSSVTIDYNKSPRYDLPCSRDAAITITENSPVAKEIMGDELFGLFCKWYRQQPENVKTHQQSHSLSY